MTKEVTDASNRSAELSVLTKQHLDAHFVSATMAPYETNNKICNHTTDGLMLPLDVWVWGNSLIEKHVFVIRKADMKVMSVARDVLTNFQIPNVEQS